MGYMHIDNLYKNQDILMFKECYAMEKIHGTSAHIHHSRDNEPRIRYFSGCVKQQRFVDLFEKGLYDYETLVTGLLGCDLDVTIYGEAYGASVLGMSETYGKELRFVAFDVKIGDCWLSVPQAEEFVKECGLQFVYYALLPTDIDVLNKARDDFSSQAYLNGMGNDKKMEGIVLRPLVELTKNNGQRLICKHKRDEFKETKTPREVSPERLAVLSEATAVASEWVTHMRLTHVLDKLGNPSIEKTRDVIAAMVEDVKREGEDEIVWSNEVQKAVCSATALMFKTRLQEALQVQ